jgi:hypothetical protein
MNKVIIKMLEIRKVQWFVRITFLKSDLCEEGYFYMEKGTLLISLY